MAWALITEEQARNRLTPDLLRRLTDDNRAGVPSESVIAQLIADASSKVLGYCQGLHSLEAIATAAGDDTAHEAVRLTLDAFEWMAIKRKPGAARSQDWVELMKANNAELMLLRKSLTKLDIDGPPNPPANVGGDVSPAVDSVETQRTFRRGGWGDF